MLSELRLRELFKQCYALATKSPDPRSQNAALVISDFGVVRGEGFNQFGVDVSVTPQLLAGDDKYDHIIHAEVDAIRAASTHFNVEGHHLVSPWAACKECAKTIVAFRIKRVYRHAERMQLPTHWLASIGIGDEVLKTAGVEVIEVSLPNLGGSPILVSGELWQP
jgi:deoxycytidylate deaminase